MSWRRWNRAPLLGRRHRWGRIGLIVILAMVLFLAWHRGLHRQAWFEDGGPLAPEVLDRRGNGGS